MTHPIGKIAALGLLVFISARLAFAQAVPTLLPGEIFAKTQNGCGVIGTPDFLKLSGYRPEAFRSWVEASVWTGSCANGLAEGRGAMRKVTDTSGSVLVTWDYAFGRILVEKNYFTNEGSTMYVLQNPSRSVIMPNGANPYAARWVATGVGALLIDPAGFGVTTVQIGCFTDQKLFRGCDLGNDFQVYGVRAFSKSDSSGVTTWCPNPRTPNGCEALWQEKAGPIIARIESLIAEVEAKIAADKAKYASVNPPKPTPGSPDYMPPRRTAPIPQADDPQVVGGSYRR